MSRSATVAVVRSDNRRGAVAQALALIADDLQNAVAPDVLLKPSCDGRRQLASTHADTLSATLDAVLAGGARRVVVAEGTDNATASFERLGFRKEAFGRPVDFLDLGREERAWDPVELTSVDGKPLRARVSRSVGSSGCRVSLAPARTDGAAMLGLSLANMIACVHPDDRMMIHGQAGGRDVPPGWKETLVEFLQGDTRVAIALTRFMGRVRNLRARLTGRLSDDAWKRFTRAEIDTLRTADAMHRNLVALAFAMKPNIAVIDGFVAMHREGPRHGTPIRLGTIIAGTDAVAVDSVASAVMGFEPMQVGYLRYAHASGLGVADLDAITVVGDPIASVRRPCVPHSNHAIQCHWHRLPEIDRTTSAVPAPHVSVPRVPETSRR